MRKKNKAPQSYQFSKTLKLAAAGILLSSLVWMDQAGAANDMDADLKLMYHVYSGDEYAGAIEDEQTLNKWIESQKEKLKDKYDLSSLAVNLKDELTIVPEKVFSAETHDEEVLEQIKESAAFETEAKAIELDGESIAYVRNEEEVKDMLRIMKKSAVSINEFAAYDRQSTGTLPDLKTDETRITDISIEDFKKPADVKVEPEKLVSAEKAAERLLEGSEQEETHKVAEDETIEQIIDKYDMKEETFFELNGDLEKDEELAPDSEVKVIRQLEGLEVTVKKEKRVKESIAFEEETVEDADLLKGKTRVEKEGKEGEREYTLKVVETNGKEVSQSKKDEKVTEKPQKQIVAEGTKEIPSRGTGELGWPANGGTITSHQGPRWGKHHKGIDIAGTDNLTIKSADNGKVVSAGMDGDYGNKVVIDHNNGIRTIYAHLSEIHVEPGQVVEKGESLGLMGETGFSTGVHLHFEVYSNGKLANPMDYL
ncbi:M23 family metallopeptidase [Jeotgalibacillus sp. S-D1]|uniref:peptidoglycan DD-metalloendopeptidase family protein n=1 Tax=Jeotgalibacillus sp. S-D1 TaxID=2552189 RepID=UPI001059C3B7|nr:M23 family metallopeptidase [Jeotgalibacillus sp. S-D1]TDL32036.1 M23 family metallopeptidase [Jeotgalibacillus sp. S-D1]